MTETAPETTPAAPAEAQFADPTVPPTEEERTTVGEPVAFPDPTVPPDGDELAGEDVDDDDLDDDDADTATDG